MPVAPASRLDVWLRGELVGRLDRIGPERYRFSYTPETVERHGEGALLLSASLPVRAERYPSAATKPFFEGLLPEGSARGTIARGFGLSEANGFGLLERLGADCAGAVAVVPEGDVPAGGDRGVEWLDEDALARRIRELPRSPLGVDAAEGRVRLSLAGVQEKLVVVRGADGRIGEPTGGAPSTHILKPGDERYAGLVENEAFCLRVVAEAGLRAASAEVIRVEALPRLLVERFDRAVVDDRVERIHQEDVCQALGVLPAAKYEQEGGPSLAAVVDLLRRLGAAGLARDLNDLVLLTVANVLLGNADAHGKNVALLLEPGHAARLAPAYDIVATNIYPGLSRKLAMAIGGARDPDAVDAGAWRRLAREAGLGGGIVGIVREHAQRVVDAARTARGVARDEGWHHVVIDDIVRVAEQRALRLGPGQAFPAPRFRESRDGPR